MTSWGLRPGFMLTPVLSQCLNWISAALVHLLVLLGLIL